jgi:UDP-2-acetamido-2-deoxy-ribo-hexuluronate aminotransferase
MKNNIELKDLGRQYKKYKRRIDKAIRGVLQSTSFISGKEVEALEYQLADYVGVEHCITCANGTDAMALVLMAWDIGPGCAVFVPDFTFFATAEVASLRGATPIFVDVDERTFNMDAIDLEKAILEVIEAGELCPRVVIPVDLFGLPADYDAIEKVAKKYNLLILEDAAQGFGGSINGQRACSFGDAATTSFFPAKPLGCYGDGGAIFTRDRELADVLRSLRVHGRGEDKYDNVRIGTNSRLDTLQAAILIEKLNILDVELEKVNQVANIYKQYITNDILKPIIPDTYFSSYAQFTLICNSLEHRKQLIVELRNNGIPTSVFYPKALSKQVAFEGYSTNKRINRNSLRLVDCVLSIPIHPYLTKKEINILTSTINISVKS